jgi:hypothetical protein
MCVNKKCCSVGQMFKVEGGEGEFENVKTAKYFSVENN